LLRILVTYCESSRYAIKSDSAMIILCQVLIYLKPLQKYHCVKITTLLQKNHCYIKVTVIKKSLLQKSHCCKKVTVAKKSRLTPLQWKYGTPSSGNIEPPPVEIWNPLQWKLGLDPASGNMVD